MLLSLLFLFVGPANARPPRAFTNVTFDTVLRPSAEEEAAFLAKLEDRTPAANSCLKRVQGSLRGGLHIDEKGDPITLGLYRLRMSVEDNRAIEVDQKATGCVLEQIQAAGTKGPPGAFVSFIFE